MLMILAATTYFFRLGRAGFDDAEAYSAYIASRPTIRAVFDASLNLDPGKGGGLFVFVLRWYSTIFGTGEAALRSCSAAFAVASLILVFALASEPFGAETALIAAALWALNPIALIVAPWPRMYSMFIALSRGSLLAMRKVEQRPTSGRLAMFGIVSVAMLYTHLGRPCSSARRPHSSPAIDCMAGDTGWMRRPHNSLDPLCTDSANLACTGALVGLA